MQFRVQAIRHLFATGIAGAIAITLAFAGAGVWALVAQQLALETVTVVLLWRLSRWRPRFRASIVCLRDLVPFGVRMSSIRLTQFAMTNADNFFVGIVFGKIALGYYVIAYRMFSVLNDLFIMVINRVALSTFSRLQHDTRSREPRVLSGEPNRKRAHPSGVCGAGPPGPPGHHSLVRRAVGTECSASFRAHGCCLCHGPADALWAYATGIGWIRNEFRWTLAIATAQVAAFAVAAHFSVFAVAASVGIVLIVAWPVRLLPLRKIGGIRLSQYFAHYPGLVASTLVMAAGVAAIRYAVGGAPPAVALAIEISAGVVLVFGSLRFWPRACSRS